MFFKRKMTEQLCHHKTTSSYFKQHNTDSCGVDAMHRQAMVTILFVSRTTLPVFGNPTNGTTALEYEPWCFHHKGILSALNSTSHLSRFTMQVP